VTTSLFLASVNIVSTQVAGRIAERSGGILWRLHNSRKIFQQEALEAAGLPIYRPRRSTNSVVGRIESVEILVKLVFYLLDPVE
jgi:hypothetical protein